MREIQQLIAAGKDRIREAGAPAFRRRAEAMYVQTLAQIDRKICGWGNAFRFVSNRVAFAQMDEEIDRLLGDFQGWFCAGLMARTRGPGGGCREWRSSSDTPPAAGDKS